METAQPPKFRRIASGDYETADGRFRLYQLVDVRPAAWNIEDVSFDAISDTSIGRGYDGLIVDGAATKRDALALFADWWTAQTPTKGRTMKRYAIVRNARSRSEAEAYLPDNYRVIHETVFGPEDGRTLRPTFVIEGEDHAGWTLDAYVIPRYASGLIGCEEIDLSHPLLKEVELRRRETAATQSLVADMERDGLL